MNNTTPEQLMQWPPGDKAMTREQTEMTQTEIEQLLRALDVAASWMRSLLDKGIERRDVDAVITAKTTIATLHAELEQAKAELLEQCRLNGMGAEREAWLMAQLEQAKAENERLRLCAVCGQDHGGLVCPQVVAACFPPAPTQGDV